MWSKASAATVLLVCVLGIGVVVGQVFDMDKHAAAAFPGLSVNSVEVEHPEPPKSQTGPQTKRNWHFEQALYLEWSDRAIPIAVVVAAGYALVAIVGSLFIEAGAFQGLPIKILSLFNWMVQSQFYGVVVGGMCYSLWLHFTHKTEPGTLLDVVCDPSDSYTFGALHFWTFMFHLLMYWFAAGSLITLFRGNALSAFHIVHRVLALMMSWALLEAESSFKWASAATFSVAWVLTAIYQMHMAANPQQAPLWWAPFVTWMWRLQAVVNIAIVACWWLLNQWHVCRGSDDVAPVVLVVAYSLFLALFLPARWHSEFPHGRIAAAPVPAAAGTSSGQKLKTQ